MQQAGVELLEDLTQAAAIGPFDAAKHLRRLRAARARLATHLAKTKPSIVLLVDFGDFNLPFVAPVAKRLGCRVVYFISPQLWAWGRFRLRWVTRHVDRMVVLFRFEEAFYQRQGVPVTWVGHPLMDVITDAPSFDRLQEELGLNPARMTVGLLPGSRDHEIRRHLPLFLATATRIAWQMPGVQFLVPQASAVNARLFQSATDHRSLNLHLCTGRFHDALRVMDAAVIASGTATVEAAVFGVPMAVVYRTSWPTYLAAWAVVRVPHIAMVNVIAGRAVVPEFVQSRATASRIANEVVDLLRNDSRAAQMRQALRKVTEQLGPPGAVERAARAILDELRISTTSSY